MKNIEKADYDVLKQYGKYVLVAAIVAFGGMVMCWLLKLALFAWMVWFVIFRLPAMF